jgi:hypothetical protein
VLTACEELGLELRSDGMAAEFAGTDWQRMADRLDDGAASGRLLDALAGRGD